MRLVALALVLSSVPALAGPKLELELGGGAVDWSAPQPTFTGRVGADLFGFFTPSLRVTSLSPFSASASTWLVLGELRLHTPGPVQVTGGVGLGFATADVRHVPDAPLEASVTRNAPWLQADLGLRVMLGRFWLGAAVTSAPLERQWMGTLNLGVALFGD
ncbi:MAG: hypothetical protein AB1938_30825 [Myxococcota bacterium]